MGLAPPGGGATGGEGSVSTTEPNVFISYRRGETAGHAGRLFDAMAERFGERNVFMDVDMEPGIDFPSRIKEVIGACRVLVVVMGPQWATLPGDEGLPRVADPEDFVRMEVEAALRRPEVTVIPVLVAGAQMPEPEKLPEGLRELANRNALELSDLRWRHDVGRLIRALETRLAPPTRIEPVPAPPSRPEPPPQGRPTAWLLLEGIVVAGIAGILATLIVGSPGGAAVTTVAKGTLRHGERWAIIGTALAIWITLRRGESSQIPSHALAGLLVGAIGGALGGAILSVSKDLASLDPSSPSDRDVLDQIWIGSRAVHGAFIGGLLGALWVPRRIATGMAAGLVGGVLIQLLFTAMWGNWRDTEALATGVSCGAIAGLAIGALLAASWRGSVVPSRTNGPPPPRSA